MATLSTRDTVFCAMPMYHAMSMLVAISGGLVGGARIAAAPRFVASRFWEEVRRSGATVVFHTGDMLRSLLLEPADSSDARHPVRLFVGSGLGATDNARFVRRFGAQQLTEFYASTEGPVVLVHASNEKPGSVGRPLQDAGELAIVEVEVSTLTARRNPQGRCRRVAIGEAGLLIGRLDPVRPFGQWDGFVDTSSSEARVLRDVFEPGDAWFSTGDVFRVDADGDHWLLGRKTELVETPEGLRSLREVAAAIEQIDGVAHVGVWRHRATGPVIAACSTQTGRPLDAAKLSEALTGLPPALRPALVRTGAALPMSAGYRVNLGALRSAGIDADADGLIVVRADGGGYTPVTPRNRERVRKLLAS
jgi:acyl-CoA synthetase (AMP-forming)/AMP-acid ligase II